MDDTASDLDHDDAFRVNVHVGREAFLTHTGHAPRDVSEGDAVDYSVREVVLALPVYASVGWLGVVNPGPRSADVLRGLLTHAHDAARGRHLRRT